MTILTSLLCNFRNFQPKWAINYHKILICLCLWIILAAPTVRAEESALPSPHEVDYCTPYIQRAEKKYKIPRGLLQAIALVESGVNGRPWPWALNVGGNGIYPQTYEAAVKAMRGQDGKVRKDVAVGCMQVYLAYHGHKFSAPEWLLHPEYNVAYAAQLLRKLYRTHHNWTSAVAYYHASTNKRAQYDYVCAVFSRVNRIRGTKPDAEGQRYCKIMPRTKTPAPVKKLAPVEQDNSSNQTSAGVPAINGLIKPVDSNKTK